MIVTLFLTLKSQGQLAHYHHYLRDYVSEKNFQYQTKPYLQTRVTYFQNDNEMNVVGKKLLVKMDKLDKNTNSAQLRDCMESIITAKERGLGKQWRLEITDRFEKFFDKYPTKAKALSRQDVCALIMIDTDFTTEVNSSECLEPLLKGFRLLNKNDFGSLDVAIAYLRLSNSMWMPNNNWNIERQDWSLNTANKFDPNGMICVGSRAFRQIAQAVRRRDPKLIDSAVALLETSRGMMKRKEDIDSSDSNIKYLKRQKELLIDLMKKEKKKG